MAKHADNNKLIVLIVDDQFMALQPLTRLITSEEFLPLWVSDDYHGLKVLREKPDKVRIIIIDLKSSGMGGGGFLHQARQIAPKAAILITGPLNHFLYQGGNFYEFSGKSLKHDINSILFSIAQRMGITNEDKVNNRHQIEQKEKFGVIIGRSKSINSVYQMIEKLKKSSATVLIQGESGTGKELIAQTIHKTSLRNNRPLIAVNCGAIPEHLMESELFGHERGAFTTAVKQRKGKFEIAEKGTLFLDEIGELSKNLQVKLLRVLQEKEFQRVGGNRTYKTDVRIIAATSKDLKIAVQEGHFRDDLFYRLNVVPIHIPPLRNRRKDILPLLEHFFKKITREMITSMPSLSKEARKALISYNYPGNVRELANIVERLLIICPDGEITLQDLPEEVCKEAKLTDGSSGGSLEILKELPDGGIRLDEVEKELIFKTLEKTSGNKQEASRVLGITRRLLYLRLSQYAEV